jgi:hypothetical protein
MILFMVVKSINMEMEMKIAGKTADNDFCCRIDSETTFTL